MSNYPPGVTGNEAQIAGNRYESATTDTRTCEADNVRHVVMTREARTALAQVTGILSVATSPELVTESTLARLGQLVARVEAGTTLTEVDTCHFTGEVEVETFGESRHLVTERWECPWCGNEDSRELEAEDFIDEDRYRDR